LFADSLNIIPKDTSTSSKQISNNEKKQTNNFTNTIWYIIGSPIIGWIIGFFTQKIISRNTYKKNKLSEMAFQIRQILINYRKRIRNLDDFEDIKAGDIVVECINEIEPLISNFLYYTSKTDTKKIRSDYKKYSDPYKEKTELWGVGITPQGIRHINKKPTKFVNNKIKNATDKALHGLDVLIEDIKHL